LDFYEKYDPSFYGTGDLFAQINGFRSDLSSCRERVAAGWGLAKRFLVHVQVALADTVRRNSRKKWYHLPLSSFFIHRRATAAVFAISKQQDIFTERLQPSQKITI